MLEFLSIIAGSWPIAAMVVGLSAAYVVRKSLRQAMDNSVELRNTRDELGHLRASNAKSVSVRK